MVPNIEAPSLPLQALGVPEHQSDTHEPNAPGSSAEDTPALSPTSSMDSIRSVKSIRERQAEEGKPATPVEVVYIGIAITRVEASPAKFKIGVTVHDSTYSIGYTEYTFPVPTETVTDAAEVNTSATTLEDFVLSELSSYGIKHNYKIIGGAITQEAKGLCPRLPTLLWSQLDIVCFVFKPFSDGGDNEEELAPDDEFKVDEESDSVARKAIEKFGPNNLPRLMLKYGTLVEVDAGGKAEIADLEDYRRSVKNEDTWRATLKFANSLIKNKTRIAFINSTPQGGGVALMRHALIRFLRLLGVNCKWYVPRANAEVFRITKDNHNILQAVDKEGKTLDAAKIQKLDTWCEQNANRYWLRKRGPLRAPDKGGAHVIIVDDPQMPQLVALAKKADPNRPVIYRSHIQVKADLANQEGTPTAGVWNWIWNHIKECDVFVSHPVPEFVPKIVPSLKVGYLPATTDMLDGLNKELSQRDREYYMHEFYLNIKKNQTERGVKFELDWPKRTYIVQIARFDPAKGIDDVLLSYAKLRREYLADWPSEKHPQLVIAGHGAVDDPDATPIYDATLALIRTSYPDYERDIIVMRVGPTDQILNALMRNSIFALQLSTKEGFEVKVSEALHHGRPIITTNRGGLPLQITPGASGFVLDPSKPDYHAHVAKHMSYLLRNPADRRVMSKFARENLSDEVGTVGNALSWLFLADTLARGEKVEPGTRWVNDMARDGAGLPVVVARETRLKRELIVVSGVVGGVGETGVGAP